MFHTLSGAPISAFCFGAMQFGGNADAAESGAMYRACRGAGINFFDTAYGYTEGRSEEILGRLVAQEREDVFIATKCAARGASRRTILEQFETSRKRLNIEVVDLLYQHYWDANTPLEETFETFAALIDRGAVRHIAISNYAAWQVMKAQEVARSFDIRIEAMQPMYNLVKRQAEVEILPMAMSEGLAIFPYSPLGGGLLTGKYAGGGTGRLTEVQFYSDRYAPEWMRQSAADLAALGQELGVDPATLAVAWAARHPGVTAPIISARSEQQLGPSLDAMTYQMDDALHARISALSRTPPPATDRLEELV